LNRFRLPYSNLLAAVLAFPLGCGLLSLILFFTFLVGGANGPALTVIMTSLASIAFAALLWPDAASPSAAIKQKAETAIHGVISPCAAWFKKTSLLKTMSAAERNSLLPSAAFTPWLHLVHYWVYFWGSLLSALGGWDARYFWKLSPIFYRDPQNVGMFSPVGKLVASGLLLMLPGSLRGPDHHRQETLIAPLSSRLVSAESCRTCFGI
jgi:hypothetical protein